MTSLRADLRNVALIVLGFASILLLVSPARSYPVVDDWIYWQSVGDLLRLDYAPHDWTQPIALGHLAWGAGFAAFLGHTFTALTISNLVMSLACLLTFYLLLRQLAVTSTLALLGVAVLGFNPLYVFLTYSFMTDITFLTYMLAATLFYLRGVRGHGEWWLWLGGLASALAYLTRQYGVLAMLAAIVYLWSARRWMWRRAIAIAAVPILAAIAYAVWERFQPGPLIALQMEQERAAMLSNLGPYLIERGQRFVWMLPSLGLCLLPVIRRPRNLMIAVPIFIFLVAYQVRSLQLTGTLFPQNGNILDFTGFIMFFYNANMVWSGWVWLLLGIAGSVLFSLRFASAIEDLRDWARSRPWRNPELAQDPAAILYAWSLLLVVVIVVLTPFLFDRYWLALLPALLLPTLRHESKRDSAAAPAPSLLYGSRVWLPWALLVPIALFSVVAMRDYKEHATARWAAAQSLRDGGAKPEQVRAGLEWEGFYDFKAGAQRIRETHDLRHLYYPPDAVIDPVYLVSDLPELGYSEIGSIPYRSWLDGGAERRVLLLKRK
jgi:4-amino-4-deoxy-L-arabinose transferase-like glycosyltransferase